MLGQGPRVAGVGQSWVGAASVRVMAEAEEVALPPWLRVGQAVEARDPVGDAGKATRWLQRVC